MVLQGNYYFDTVSQAKYSLLRLNENLLLTAFALLIFFIPVVWHSTSFPNQLIVGIIVNALLAGCALLVSFKKALPVMLLPAIAALLSGAIFGGFFVYLLYLVPFIWAGNAVFVYSIKAIHIVNKRNYLAAIAVSSVFKAAIIGGFTALLIAAGLVPAVFLIPMSLIQLITALAGGLIAGTIHLMPELNERIADTK